jgi:predicted ATPase
VAFTLLFAALCHDYRGEQQATQERVEALIALATEQEFGYLLTLGQIMRGWGRCMQGQGEEGMAQIRQGLNAMRNEGAEILRPYFLALLANTYSTQGQTAEGLEVVAEALATGHATGQRYYEAELHRLKGELLLQRALPDERQVETCFQEALDVSRRQQAKSLELRATTSLSRLWQQQGRRVEARELLAAVFQWFTEGFDTTDLQEAQALLEELE